MAHWAASETTGSQGTSDKLDLRKSHHLWLKDGSADKAVVIAKTALSLSFAVLSTLTVTQ